MDLSPHRRLSALRVDRSALLAAAPSLDATLDSDDDSSSTQEDEECPIVTVSKAREILADLQDVLQAQQARDDRITELLQDARQMAVARYLHETQVGALLAMKKVYRLTQERNRVAMATQMATTAIADLQNRLKKQHSHAIASSSSSDANHDEETTEIDIGLNNAAALNDIQVVLNDFDGTTPPKNELLQQVQDLIQDGTYHQDSS